MYCKKCGKEIADNSTFCMYCGDNQNDNNKKITVHIPEIEIKTSTKQKNIINKILIILYIVWCIFSSTFLFSETLMLPVTVGIILLPFVILLPYLLFKLLKWIFKLK